MGYNIHIEGVTTTHWFLAYAGLLIQVFLKAAQTKGSIWGSIGRNDVFTTVASVIAIPVILIVCTDTSLREIIPINYVTAVLAGLQTHLFLGFLMDMGKKKLQK